MKLRMMSLLLLILMVISPFSALLVKSAKKSEYVIMFDESHGQFFDHRLMSRAINALYDLSSNATKVNVKIIFNNNSRFNATNLQGIDLLIVTNPGYADNDSFTLEERQAIFDFMERGGSLFLLANPLTMNDNITGHANFVNSILSGTSKKQLTSARIRSGLNISHSTVIIDDFHSEFNNDSYVSVHPNVDHPIFQQDTLIENITVYSSAIEIGSEDSKYAVGRAPFTAYYVNENYEVMRDIVNNFVTWLFVKQFPSSRLVLCGSTIMFSDLLVSNNTSWIDVQQNLSLWKNIILWLLNITPHESKIVLQAWSFEYFALAVAIIAAFIFAASVFIYSYKLKRKTKLHIKVIKK